MLRADIEKWMKENNINQIDVLETPTSIAIYSLLRGGKLVDYTYHVLDRKRNYWGYIDWLDATYDGEKYVGANADLVSFEGERIPHMRSGKYVDPIKQSKYDTIVSGLKEKGLFKKYDEDALN